MDKLRIQDVDLQGKRVLVRVDFNVPLRKDGTISDDTRIRLSLPTIRYILDKGGKVILMSHLGRPDGQKKNQYSLSVCAKALSSLLQQPVFMTQDCVGEEVKKKVASLKEKEVLLLENLRFYPAEEAPDLDPNFAKELASLGDVYVNDAFGSAHRAHSSTATITRYFPKMAVAGMLMEKEIDGLEHILLHPKRPFAAIVGGAKISTKIAVLKALTEKVDMLFIGGAMAFTFFKAQGIRVGNSLVEEDQIETALQWLRDCAKKNISLHFPVDSIVADLNDPSFSFRCVSMKEGIPQGLSGVDIGPATITEWEKNLTKAATIFWNGPVGIFEKPPFATGTKKIAEILAKSHAITVVGGGDSVAAVTQMGLEKDFTHLSTGGGASLEFLEKGHLPGVDALTSRKIPS